jgi:hypothetical protein
MSYWLLLKSVNLEENSQSLCSLQYCKDTYMEGGGIELRAPNTRGRLAVTAATFYTWYCHQSPLFVTLEKECIESKFTFSDKLFSRNETIHALFRWEPNCNVGRKQRYGNFFVAYWKLAYLTTLIRFVRSEVFTAVTMKYAVFWDVTPCGSCKNRRFGGT